MEPLSTKANAATGQVTQWILIARGRSKNVHARDSYTHGARKRAGS